MHNEFSGGSDDRFIREKAHQVISPVRIGFSRVLNGVMNKREDELGLSISAMDAASPQTLHQLANAELRFFLSTLAERVVLRDKTLSLVGGENNYVEVLTKLLNETKGKGNAKSIGNLLKERPMKSWHSSSAKLQNMDVPIKCRRFLPTCWRR